MTNEKLNFLYTKILSLKVEIEILEIAFENTWRGNQSLDMKTINPITDRRLKLMKEIEKINSEIISSSLDNN